MASHRDPYSDLHFWDQFYLLQDLEIFSYVKGSTIYAANEKRVSY